MFGKLRGITVNGYRPFNGLNVFLSILGGIALALFVLGITADEFEATVFVGIVTIVFFALLLYRNRKVGSVPRMIYFSGVSLVFGALAIVLLFISAIGAGMSIMNGGSGNFGQTFSDVFGSSGGNKNEQNAGFSKQDDLNAQMQGYANAQQYQDLTGFSGHDIDPDDDYTRA